MSKAKASVSSTASNYILCFLPSSSQNYAGGVSLAVVDYNKKGNLPPRSSGDFRDVRYLSDEAVENILNKSAWKQEAHVELENIKEEAKEEDFRPPTMKAIDNAKMFIDNLNISNLSAPSVYPTKDRDVAIFFTSEAPGAGVLFLCPSDGGGACFSSIGGKNRRTRYSDASEMSEPSVIKLLQNLINWDEQSVAVA